MSEAVSAVEILQELCVPTLGPEGEIAIEWIEHNLQAARRAGIEEAAKVAENTDWEALGPGWRTNDRIAAAIRALNNEGEG